MYLIALSVFMVVREVQVLTNMLFIR